MRIHLSSSRSLLTMFLWMGIIFTFSSMPSSGPSAEGMPFLLLLERKGAHVFEYLVLSILAWNAFRSVFPRTGAGYSMMLASGLSLLYAFSDETHQLFVPGREGKLSDIGIDAIGIAFGMFLVAGFLSRERKQ